eukprot:g1151.t1
MHLRAFVAPIAGSRLAMMAEGSFQERYDSIIGALIELRGELTKAEEEKAEAQAELAKMQTLGAQLQTALEKSQRELGQAEGNAAYYKVLLEESGKVPPAGRLRRCLQRDGWRDGSSSVTRPCSTMDTAAKARANMRFSNYANSIGFGEETLESLFPEVGGIQERASEGARQQPMPPKPPKEIGGGRFEIQKALGAGCFGQVWKGVDKTTNEVVAIKFEDNQAKGSPNQLKTEYDTLRIVNASDSNVQGFSKAHWFGIEGRFSCLAGAPEMVSLMKLSAQTEVLIADQVIRRMEFLHSVGLIHRDIKPENFMFGVGSRIHIVYLIDFGLGRRYWRDQQHAPMRSGLRRFRDFGWQSEAHGHQRLFFARGSFVEVPHCS